VGLRLADGLLRVQAHALSSTEGVDAWMLLWWNRQTRFVRFACTEERASRDSAPLRNQEQASRDSASLRNQEQASRDSASLRNPSREVWVHGDLPAAAADEVSLDRLLGLVVEGAVAVREYQQGRVARARG